MNDAENAKVNDESKDKVAKRMTFKDLRSAREISPEKICELMNWTEADRISFEASVDFQVTKLRQYVEKLGGTLDLVASFPGEESIKIIEPPFKAGQNLKCEVVGKEAGGYKVLVLDAGLDGFLPSQMEFEIGAKLTAQFVCKSGGRLLLAARLVKPTATDKN